MDRGPKGSKKRMIGALGMPRDSKKRSHVAELQLRMRGDGDRPIRKTRSTWIPYTPRVPIILFWNSQAPYYSLFEISEGWYQTLA